MHERGTETDKHREQSNTGSSVMGWWEYEAALRVNCVHFQNLKKFIKITKKVVLRAVEPTQQCSFKLLNRKICFDYLSATWFEHALAFSPQVSEMSWSVEMTVMLNWLIHSASNCFRLESTVLVRHLLSLWLLLADPGSSCYVLRLLQICSGVLLWSDE